jgi:hypothetical protein
MTDSDLLLDAKRHLAFVGLHDERPIFESRPDRRQFASNIHCLSASSPYAYPIPYIHRSSTIARSHAPSEMLPASARTDLHKRQDKLARQTAHMNRLGTKFCSAIASELPKIRPKSQNGSVSGWKCAPDNGEAAYRVVSTLMRPALLARPRCDDHNEIGNGISHLRGGVHK